jgi:hypothetical protein
LPKPLEQPVEAIGPAFRYELIDDRRTIAPDLGRKHVWQALQLASERIARPADF